MNRLMLTILISVFVGILLINMGSKPQDIERFKDKNIKLTGVISLVGNEPFTRMGIRTPYGHLIYLPKEDQKRYNNLIAEHVDAEGILKITTIYSADHKRKFQEYYLSNAAVRKADKRSNSINQSMTN